MLLGTGPQSPVSYCYMQVNTQRMCKGAGK